MIKRYSYQLVYFYSFLRSKLLSMVIVSFMILPIIFKLIGTTTPVIVSYIALMITCYFICDLSRRKTKKFLEKEEETQIFLSSSILKLEQGQNCINALRLASQNLHSTLKDEVADLVDKIILKGANEVVFDDFCRSNKSILIKNYRFLILVTLKYSNQPLDYMYQEFIEDVKAIGHQQISLEKKVRGFKSGLKFIMIFILLTTVAISMGLNVGVFNKISSTTAYKNLMRNFLLILYFTYIAIELYMDYLLRRRYQ